MTIFGFYPSIWIYWVFHIAVVIVYGIYILTRPDADYADDV